MRSTAAAGGDLEEPAADGVQDEQAADGVQDEQATDEQATDRHPDELAADGHLAVLGKSKKRMRGSASNPCIEAIELKWIFCLHSQKYYSE